MSPSFQLNTLTIVYSICYNIYTINNGNTEFQGFYLALSLKDILQFFSSEYAWSSVTTDVSFYFKY